MNNTPKHRQQWILEELKKYPLLSFGEACQLYVSKWQKSERTFARDWESAQKQLQTYQKTINEELTRQVISTEVEARKKDLFAKIDALNILADIARGKGREIDGEKFFPSYRERISAITQLSKMEGWEAPIKQEVKGDFSVTEVKIVWEGEPDE
ncbi:MAG: hypothetical protein ACFNUO_00415 [Capnocytophaga ochracea]|jgi:hypothetical protein